MSHFHCYLNNEKNKFFGSFNSPLSKSTSQVCPKVRFVCGVSGNARWTSPNTLIEGFRILWSTASEYTYQIYLNMKFTCPQLSACPSGKHINAIFETPDNFFGAPPQHFDSFAEKKYSHSLAELVFYIFVGGGRGEIYGFHLFLGGLLGAIKPPPSQKKTLKKQNHRFWAIYFFCLICEITYF